MSRRLQLQWLGASIVIEVHAAFESVFADLQMDFAAFSSYAGDPEAYVHLLPRSHFPSDTFFRPLMKWKGKRVGLGRYNGRWVRMIQGPHGEWAVLESARPLRVRIFSNDDARAYEWTYLYALSFLGEGLERRGYVRLHGAGFTSRADGSTALFLAESGRGKSTLSFLARQSGRFELLADECLLCRKGLIHSFPVPLAVSRKFAFDVSGRTRSWQPDKKLLPVTASEARLPDTAIAFFSEEEAARTCPQWVQFMIRVVSGAGLAQMLEIYLRPWSLPSLAVTAVRRAVCAFQMILLPGFSFVVGSLNDPQRSAKILERIDDGDSKPSPQRSLAQR